jgi:hypothetical protein
MAIWCVNACGMQWRAIGLLCGIPFGTLYGLFARWTRLGLCGGCAAAEPTCASKSPSCPA